VGQKEEDNKTAIAQKEASSKNGAKEDAEVKETAVETEAAPEKTPEIVGSKQAPVDETPILDSTASEANDALETTTASVEPSSPSTSPSPPPLPTSSPPPLD